MKINHTLISIGLTCLLLPTLSYAFFCPTNFNQIDFGDTIDHVQQQCGKPDKQESEDLEPPVPQEWSYFIPQTVALSANQQGQGTLKTSFTFDKDGKAINISVNGIGVGASTICGRTVQLGDSRDQIKAACGEPSFVNKQSNPDVTPSQPNKKIVIFTYNSTPPQTLTFEDGRLTGRN